MVDILSSWYTPSNSGNDPTMWKSRTASLPCCLYLRLDSLKNISALASDLSTAGAALELMSEPIEIDEAPPGAWWTLVLGIDPMVLSAVPPVQRVLVPALGLYELSTPPSAAIVAPPPHPAMVLFPPGAACSLTLGISPMLLSATPPTQWVREGL